MPDDIDPEKPRRDFLLAMYGQLMNDINRHIVVVWQSVGVLFGAFAVFALVEKKIVSLDIATSLILLLCAWVVAHVYDAGYWYNRNLVIIANIERQFLRPSDLREIHYYFGRHRKTGLAKGEGRIGTNLLAMGCSTHGNRCLAVVEKEGRYSLCDVLKELPRQGN
jgi:hypothetical protein